MRRLLRWLVNGLWPGLGKALCLLSLLACAGAGWFGWRGARAGWAEAEVAAPPIYVSLCSSARDFNLYVVARWPGGAGAWASEGPSAPHFSFGGPWHWAGGLKPPAPLPRRPWATREAYLMGVHLESGPLAVRAVPGGTYPRLSSADWRANAYDKSYADPRMWSEPLPYWCAGVPHWLLTSFFALPPLLWLALRSRRLYARRRRRRLGLCARCGYDLTGNTSGRCSECGTTVEAVRRVTA